jgi:hypothetical protein
MAGTAAFFRRKFEGVLMKKRGGIQTLGRGVGGGWGIWFDIVLARGIFCLTE